jgi:hypothetical protein
MLVNSTEIVSNLKESRGRLSTINSDLESRELITDSEHLASIFAGVRSNLLRTVNFMDQIAAFNPAKFKNNGQQVANVQSLANLTQKSLVQARTELDKLSGNAVIPITEKTAQELSQLYVSFMDLADIYSTQVQDSHLTFKRLDEPDVSILPDFNSSGIVTPFFGPTLLSGHRNLVISAVNNFAGLEPELNRAHKNPILDLVQNFITGQHTGTHEKLATEIFSPLLLSLAKDLVNERDLIYQDCDELTLKHNSEYKPEQYPYLESFVGSINEVVQKPISVDDVINAIKDNSAYSSLLSRMTKDASSSSKVKISDYARTVLTLQSLRIKHQNQDSHPDLEVNLETIQAAKALGGNDRQDPIKLLTLGGIDHLTQKHLKELDMLDVNERLLSSLNKILLPDTAKTIVTNADVAISVHQLKKEFNSSGGLEKAFQDPESEISRLFKKHKLIFIKSGVDQERLKTLDAQTNNANLRAVLRDIFNAAIKYNSIDQNNAAELIYILGQGLGIDMAMRAKFKCFDSMKNNFRPDDAKGLIEKIIPKIQVLSDKNKIIKDLHRP